MNTDINEFHINPLKFDLMQFYSFELALILFKYLILLVYAIVGSAMFKRLYMQSWKSVQRSNSELC